MANKYLDYAGLQRLVNKIKELIPTSLPADGGNADTVGGFTVGTNVPADAVFTDTKTTINGKTGAISKADIVALGIPEQGPKGDKGDDGHTPIKGTDYWTTADQTAIVADVLAALPDGDGVMY